MGVLLWSHSVGFVRLSNKHVGVRLECSILRQARAVPILLFLLMMISRFQHPLLFPATFCIHSSMTATFPTILLHCSQHWSLQPVACPSRSCMGALYISVSGLQGVVLLGAICLSHCLAAH